MLFTITYIYIYTHIHKQYIYIYIYIYNPRRWAVQFQKNPFGLAPSGPLQLPEATAEKEIPYHRSKSLTIEENPLL